MCKGNNKKKLQNTTSFDEHNISWPHTFHVSLIQPEFSINILHSLLMSLTKEKLDYIYISILLCDICKYFLIYAHKWFVIRNLVMLCITLLSMWYHDSINLRQVWALSVANLNHSLNNRIMIATNTLLKKSKHEILVKITIIHKLVWILFYHVQLPKNDCSKIYKELLLSSRCPLMGPFFLFSTLFILIYFEDVLHFHSFFIDCCHLQGIETKMGKLHQ